MLSWTQLCTSGSLEQKLDLNGFVRKLYLARLVTAQHASAEQCRQIGVNGFHISSYEARCFADGDRASAAQCLEQFPALGGEHFPQQF